MNSTRVLIRVVRCTTVHKDVVAGLPEFAEHQIIQAPRGTVFVVGDAQWSALASLFPAPPEADRVDLATVPEPFSWSQRSKSVHPLPGGYDGYLQALRALLDTLVDQRPAVNDFPQVVTELYSVTDNRANLMTSFLKKITVVAESGGVAVPSEWASAWAQIARNEIIIGLLHSRVRFVGEMLAVDSTAAHCVSAPRDPQRALRHVVEHPGSDRTASRLVHSAGDQSLTENQPLSITPAGEAFLSLISVASFGYRSSVDTY